MPKPAIGETITKHFPPVAKALGLCHALSSEVSLRPNHVRGFLTALAATALCAALWLTVPDVPIGACRMLRLGPLAGILSFLATLAFGRFACARKAGPREAPLALCAWWEGALGALVALDACLVLALLGLVLRGLFGSLVVPMGACR